MSFENNGSEDAIVDEGRQFIVAAYSRPGDVFYAAVKAIENKQEELKLKYPDCHNYRLYNILIGSSKVVPAVDFPGDDSVVKFLRSL